LDEDDSKEKGMQEPKAVVKAQLGIIGSRDDIQGLFAALQAAGLLTAPKAVAFEWEVMSEEDALGLRDTLHAILGASRAVVLDKSTTTLTLKEPIPDLKQTQGSLFDQFEVLEEKFAKRSATIRPLKLETQIEVALISDGPQTPEDLMRRFPGTERATLMKILDAMWQAGVAEPYGDDAWSRVEA
jgi:hypothetical protein